MDVINNTDIVVLGTGCPKCKKLSENVKKVIDNTNLNCSFAYLTNSTLISSLGIMSSPVLIIKGKTVSAGKLLNEKEIIKLFQENNFL